MTGVHNKAAVISKWLGIFMTVIGTIVSAFAIGSFSFAWNTNAQQVATQTKLQVVQTQIANMQEARLPERMASIESTVKSTDKTVDDIKEIQRETNQKIDVLIQGQMRKSIR